MNCGICGSWNMLSKDVLENLGIKKLKQSPSIEKALINRFTIHSFICRGRNLLFFLSTSDWFEMFGSSDFRSDLEG